MGQFVTANAVLQCSFGMAPMPLTVIDPMRPKCGNMMMANIMDNKPMVNIKPFGMCQNPANPTVAAATAAAMGVLTPMPCMPVVTAPWSPPAQVKISGMPALINNAKCMCTWGGVISINFPGNTAQPTSGK